MKTPLLIPLLILTISVTLGWRQWMTLQQLRAREHALTAAASVAAAERETGERRSSSGNRESRADHEAEARRVTAAMIASLVEQSVHAPGEPYSNMERRIEKILEQLYQMNGRQLRMVIAELLNDPQPDNNAWYRKSISTAITALATTDPEAAMAFLEDDQVRERAAWARCYQGVIGKWASLDPLAALAWMRENPTKVRGHEGRAPFIIGLATKDPKLALQSLLEFEVYDLRGDGAYEGRPDFSVVRQVARSARTLEDRATLLGMLREIADRPGDDADNIKGLLFDNALHAMAEGIGTYGYERASAWLDSLNLRPAEIAPLMRGLRISETQTMGDTGKWFEWMGEKLSPEDFQATAHQRIWEWVREDPRAVKEWLATAADGPAKHLSGSEYASALAAQQPEP